MSSSPAVLRGSGVVVLTLDARARLADVEAVEFFTDEVGRLSSPISELAFRPCCDRRPFTGTGGCLAFAPFNLRVCQYSSMSSLAPLKQGHQPRNLNAK